jgi:hypothetical protein
MLRSQLSIAREIVPEATGAGATNTGSPARQVCDFAFTHSADAQSERTGERILR